MFVLLINPGYAICNSSAGTRDTAMGNAGYSGGESHLVDERIVTSRGFSDSYSLMVQNEHTFHSGILYLKKSF
jgi:hypothetical protein